MKTRFLIIAGMIASAAATRLIPHPYNFAPITAIALFGGAQFRSRSAAFLVPFTAMFLSDLIIGFHTQLLTVYLSFGLIVLLGRWLQQHKTILRIGTATLTSSLLFFVITNFGVWALDSLYPKNWQGLVTCYIAAIPFFQNTLWGDVLYTVTLFGGVVVMERWLPAFRGQREIEALS